jgi:hypothetical protein
MERKNATKAAISAETIRRAFVWAGVLMGLAIVLKDVIEATEFTYVMMVVIVAWVVDQTPPLSLRNASSKWAGPLSAAVVIAVAVAMKLVMEW